MLTAEAPGRGSRGPPCVPVRGAWFLGDSGSWHRRACVRGVPAEPAAPTRSADLRVGRGCGLCAPPGAAGSGLCERGHGGRGSGLGLCPQQLPARGRPLLPRHRPRVSDLNARPRLRSRSPRASVVPEPQGSRRRKRTKFSKSQCGVLVEAFEKDPYPDVTARRELARRTQIPEPRIQVRRPAGREPG